VPVLVITGSQDALTPLGDAEELAEFIPHARLEVISGAAHGLMAEAPNGFNEAVLRFLADVDAAEGALSFYGIDRLVARRAPAGEHGSVGIALGALLDGVPESVAIAISLIGGGAVSGPMVIAVLASNLPEGMASTPGFRRAGWPTKRIVALWFGIAAAGAVAAMIGRVALGDASGDVLGAINAFAAGTILTMIASVMLPTAFADGREEVGLLFVLGFALLGGLTTLGA
jgi:ZIP family zinc transporter